MAISQESLNNFKQSVGNFDLSSLNASYDVSRTDGSIFNFFGGTTISAKNLVGITPELVTDFGTALDTYKSNITTYLNLMEAKEATVGFKGEAVNSAIKNLKNSLRSTGVSKGTKRVNTNPANSIFSRAVQLL